MHLYCARGLRTLLPALLAVVPSMSRADCTDVSYAKLRPPKYPEAAIAAKAEGRVLVQVTIGVDGVPGDLVLSTSSGNADLDQAALDAVAEWRFNPHICNGKPVVGEAVVPVEFNLHEAMADGATTAVSSNENEPDANRTIPTKENRELAPDPKSIGAANAAELLRQLRDDESMHALKPHRIDASTMIMTFVEPEERTVFDVVVSTEHGWNAVTGGGWTSIIRTRFVSMVRVTRELYTQVCDGDDDWCKFQQMSYLQLMRESPPPIPPPAPLHGAPNKH
jgi:TonB family protein